MRAAHTKPSRRIKCIDPTPMQTLRATQAYLDAGLSFLPIAADQTKQPAFEHLPSSWGERHQCHAKTWKVFCQRQPTIDEIRSWFNPANQTPCGLAVIAGEVSGNLEILDLDNWEIVQAYRGKLEVVAPGLFGRLVRVKTPRPGMHLYYRCELIGKSMKLARVPETINGRPQSKTLIETKGEGGYCLAPPSPRTCHPRQECYQFVSQRDLRYVPTITLAEREMLLETACSFDRWDTFQNQRRRDRGTTYVGPSGELRPGDDFDRRADWGEILQPHGWVYVGEGGESDYWRRPGKKEGVSATTNYAESDLLYVFSTNAHPFEERTSYSKFAAYTQLEHDGDFCEAASELSQLGYGRRSPLRTVRSCSIEGLYAGKRLRSRKPDGHGFQ